MSGDDIQSDQPVGDGRSATGHQFNNDLLTNPGDIDRAKSAFPKTVHVLSHPALQVTFRHFNQPANAAKRRGRVAGLLAIGMGALALGIAAATPVYRHYQNISVLGGISAGLGVLSIVIGLGGVLYSGAKRRWLCNRVMTERLRQFHFQAFVCRWREIAGSLASQEAAQYYVEQREMWFNRSFAASSGQLDSELTDLLDDESDSQCWLHPLPRLPLPGEQTPDLEELFASYRELPIMHQLHYANYKLRSNQDALSWSPRLQEIIFSYTTLICILAIFGIHLWIAFSVLLDGHVRTLVPILFKYESGNLGFDVHVGVIWIAIAALAIRALQEGLQPEREIERYRHYRAGVRAIRDRFDEAATAAEKFQVMLEMERASFDEFRNFLRSNNEARFVI